MPQDRRDGRKAGHRPYVRAVSQGFAAASLSLVIGLNVTAACAQTSGSDSEGLWSRMMRTVGVRSSADPSAEINYTERPPLVVPPTRELPAPTDQPGQTAAWPRGAPKTVKRVRTSNEVVPSTAVQNPNPPFQKKPWYNPAGWFSREEYANFGGEPVRRDLTEPPAGYRIPSAEQPYGISPEKKGYKARAQDRGLAAVGGSSAQPGR